MPKTYNLSLIFDILADAIQKDFQAISSAATLPPTPEQLKRLNDAFGDYLEGALWLLFRIPPKDLSLAHATSLIKTLSPLAVSAITFKVQQDFIPF